MAYVSLILMRIYMPQNYDDRFSSEIFELKQRLNILLAQGKVSNALRFLDRFSGDKQMMLFEPSLALNARRRLAFLYKIDLLRSLRRIREALAWACLECELFPENVEAQAIKEQLKHRLGLLPQNDTTTTADVHLEQDDIWSGVAGMRELKAILQRDVILPLEEPELYRKYRVPLPNGILLYGPPGCGKTFIAQKLGRILGFHFLDIKPSDLGSIYVHGAQENIGRLFNKARENAPCLLFFDELDALLPVRDESVGFHYSAEVNELLTQLNKSSEQRVLVVGATNRIDKIDPAALRPGRFDKKIFVGQPDLEARTQLLKLYMDKRPQEKIDFVKMARECEGYTCAELEYIVNESARRALSKHRPICWDDLLTSLAKNPPAHANDKSSGDDNLC
jgi:SpoVK/Ycf46/Vps4 family AAA+-type ATPase